MRQLKIVPRLSVTAQARQAIAEYKAERNGQRRLTDDEVRRADQAVLVETINGQITIDNYDWQWQLSWKNIMHCKSDVNLAGAARQATESGHRFFAFADRVYFADCKGRVEDTGLATSDIT